MAKQVELNDWWQERISDQLKGMEYGSVLITVHDGRIVQIDRTERKRFDPSAGVAPAAVNSDSAQEKKTAQSLKSASRSSKVANG
ncbi:uncharacterized protein DUF2292 [Paenibacillus cellulosilyticus]|uniref:Uncharacterized protein DUF2292 n=1 Tax=Paenibacillus cellulosilyticus TaxID=375489 RepID=A0A2V2YQY5_9BACL|nr:YezD family protein [Paenibacillus cellulosilyticus]PWV92444.1 uncharacterized protein DUF2292 [Paenibacillus cellulosilyticus]QKS47021.1 YezD family protein [Paenibacillus cellulosilyticus]